MKDLINLMYKYIIVDDEILIRKGIIKKIENLNLPLHCAFEAQNGEEAQNFLINNQIDFIITDMDMPLMDGVEFLSFLTDTYNSIPVLVISGYKKFEYLQTSIKANVIDYILKPFSKEDLYNPLKLIMKEIEFDNTAVNEIIKNDILGQKTKLSTDTITTIINNMKDPVILLIYGQLHSNIEKNIKYLYKLSEDSQVHLSIVEKKYFNDNKSLFNDNLLSIYDGIIEPRKLDVYFEYCVNGLNSRTKNDSTIIKAKNDITCNEKKILYSQAKILYHVEAGNHEILISSLPKLLEYEVLDDDTTLLTLKKTLILIVHKTKNFLNNYFDATSNYTAPEFINELYNLYFSFDDSIIFTTNFLSNIAKSMASEELYTSKDTIENVKQYIDIHYSDPLNLDLLSDMFFINSSYLSTLFKEYTGISFSKYLTYKRIEKSKLLLQETNFSIEKIANKVGYENTKYFFRVFKKNVDKTPEEYRANQGNKIQ